MPSTLTPRRHGHEMATATHQQALIDDLLVRITGLVRARNFLQQRDANEADLSAEIARLQWRLARIVRKKQRIAQEHRSLTKAA
jgi:hypothetical protein